MGQTLDDEMHHNFTIDAPRSAEFEIHRMVALGVLRFAVLLWRLDHIGEHPLMLIVGRQR